MERIPSSCVGRPSDIPMRRRKKPWGDETTELSQVENSPLPARNPVVPLATPSPVIPVHAVRTSASAKAVTVEAILAGQLSEETKRAYRSDLRHFLAFLGQPAAMDNPHVLITALAGVDREKAAAYRDHMLQTEQKRASTVNRHLSVASMVYDILHEDGVVENNPFSRVKRPKVGNVGKTPALAKEQAESILAQPDIATPRGRRDRVILLLLFFCGLRRSEVVKVEAADFYESQGHILLRVHGKGRSDKAEAVMIPRKIWPEIRDYLAGRNGFLFTGQSTNRTYNRSDRPISAGRVYLLFKDYCGKAGIDPDAFSPHSTRATFITLTLKGGADVRSVMYAAKHSDPATTIRYDRQRLDMDNHASNHLNLDIGQ